MNIIIVDDEKVIRNGLSYIISQLGTGDKVVGIFAEAAEALDFCARRHTEIDLMITDIRMPNMDGLELIQHVRSRYPHIQGIVLSGYDDFDYARTALRLGAVDYLLKPADKEELRKVLHKAKAQLANNRQQQKNPSRSVIVDNLMSGLFRGDPGTFKEAAAYLDQAFPADGPRSYCAAGVAIDHLPERKMNAADKSLFQYFIRKSAEEMLCDETPPKGLILQDKAGDVIMLFILEPHSEGRRLTAIPDKLNQLLDHIAGHIRYPVTIGISRQVQSIADFSEMYNQVQSALKSRMMAGTNRLIFYDPPLKDQLSPHIPSSAFRQVITAYAVGDAEQLEAAGLSFVDKLYHAKVTPEQAIGYLLKLFYQVSEYLGEIGMQSLESNITTWSSIKQTVELCTTRELLEFHLVDLLKKILEEILAYRAESKPKFILQAVQYIQANYASDITLNEVADVIGMYPTYFSEQFKHHMGETFIDYLTKVRIQQAKKLLKESEIPVFQLCEKVGYATPAHFTKVFKKATGVTPSKYREDATSHRLKYAALT